MRNAEAWSFGASGGPGYDPRSRTVAPSPSTRALSGRHFFRSYDRQPTTGGLGMPKPANRPHRPQDAADALAALREWREQVLRRDQLVMAAIDAGVNDD